MRAKKRTPISGFRDSSGNNRGRNTIDQVLLQNAQDKIVFCPLHREAETMLSICDYLRKFLAGIKVANPSDENLIREVILPCVDGAIAAATTKGS
jgi:hypothetical protein